MIVTHHSEIRNGTDVRDSLLNALNSVYAANYEGKDWYVCKYERGSASLDMNIQLVTDILALLAFTNIDPENNTRQKYYGETAWSEIRNMIWMVHSGGSTADYATDKIADILNITKED